MTNPDPIPIADPTVKRWQVGAPLRDSEPITIIDGKAYPLTKGPTHAVRVPQDLKRAQEIADYMMARDVKHVHHGDATQITRAHPAYEEAAQVIRNLVAELQILHGANVDHEVLVLARVYGQLSSESFATSFGGNMTLYRQAILKLIKGGQ